MLALCTAALLSAACGSDETIEPPVTPPRDAGVDAGVDAGPGATDGGRDAGPAEEPDAGVEPSFSLATSPEQTVQFMAGASSSSGVFVTRQPSFTGDVSVTVEGLPPHVRTVQPLPLIVPGSEQSALLGYVPDEFAAYGRYPLTLVGVGGGERVEFPLTLEVQPGPAALDSAFGASGVMIPGLGPSPVTITSMAVQPDGKWILAGFTGSVIGLRDVWVARLLPGGTPDPAFGTNGVVVSDICGGDDYVDAVAVLPDGRIVVAGGAVAGTNTCGGTQQQGLLMARYTAAGVLDTTFGGTGVRTLKLTTGIGALHGLTVDANGRYLGVGTGDNSGTDMVVIRMLPTGALDTTFSGDGVASVDLGRTDDGRCVVAEPDGKIMLAGTSTGSFNLLALRRLNADGSTDGTFRYLPLAAYPEITPRSLHRLSDGKWLVAGKGVSYGGSTSAVVVRLTSSGAEDSSFGDDGYKSFNTFAFPASVTDTVVGSGLLADGTIVVATSSQDAQGAFAVGVTHLRANGTATLRSHRTDLPGDEKPTAAVLGADGFLRVAGTRTPEGGTQAAPFVIRFHPY